jgi:hypothetical protein
LLFTPPKISFCILKGLRCIFNTIVFKYWKQEQFKISTRFPMHEVLWMTTTFFSVLLKKPFLTNQCWTFFYNQTNVEVKVFSTWFWLVEGELDDKNPGIVHIMFLLCQMLKLNLKLPTNHFLVTSKRHNEYRPQKNLFSNFFEVKI